MIYLTFPLIQNGYNQFLQPAKHLKENFANFVLQSVIRFRKPSISRYLPEPTQPSKIGLDTENWWTEKIETIVKWKH